MKPKDFIGVKATYDEHGTQIYGNNKKGEQQLILEVRGWGAIQNLFNIKDKISLDKAGKFQDEVGQWFVDAINEKLKRENSSKEKIIDLEQLFENNSDCYADTWIDDHDTVPPVMVEGKVIVAMTKEKFIEVIAPHINRDQLSESFLKSIDGIDKALNRAPDWLDEETRKKAKDTWNSHKVTDDGLKMEAVVLIKSHAKLNGYDIRLGKAKEILDKYCL
jgi:hypothetical protein